MDEDGNEANQFDELAELRRICSVTEERCLTATEKQVFLRAVELARRGREAGLG